MKIVTPENFDECVEELLKVSAHACDTETTGLYAYKKDRLFSIQISDATVDYYFNFIEYDTGEPVLDFEWIKKLQPLFDNKLVFMQNAKFDMAFLYKQGLRFDLTDLHDTEVAGRIIRNDHLKYSLDEQAKRELGETKDDSVMAWLKENKKFTAVSVPGKDKIDRNYHFNEVPYEMITRYGCKDTRLTYDLGMKQKAAIDQALAENGYDAEKTIAAVYEMEKRLTHVCFEMERIGIQIDREYCEEAVRFESDRIEKAEAAFRDHTGFEIVDSGKCLGPVFEKLGFVPGRTEGDDYEVTDKFLNTVTHPLGAVVQTYREARKRANTYFRSYLYYADSKGVVHANMRQAGTKTGRFSYWEPNLQNIPSDDPDSEQIDNSPYPIRRAFIPREGFFFLSVDYNQMEFRMMLDGAGQHDLIAKIKDGHDPHDATAELTGLKRKAAKTLNFGLLYGMGLAKLGDAIGVALEDARIFKRQYFAALPLVKDFIYLCSDTIKTRFERSPKDTYIKTWFGRRCYFDDSKWAYKGANARIQGGCADVVKIAMVRLFFKTLQGKMSRMVMQIHDELLFEIAFSEMDLIPEIIDVMETTYPQRYLPLTCSMGFSLKSFYDIVEKDPRLEIVKKAGNFILRTNSAEA